MRKPLTSAADAEETVTARISPDGRRGSPTLASKHGTRHAAGPSFGDRRTIITSNNARTSHPDRFRGPTGSGNGGYVCGRIAAYADGPVAVTLRRPPPLAAPMTVEQGDDGSLRIRHGSTLIAEATSPPGLLAPDMPGPVWVTVPRPGQALDAEGAS